MDMGLMTGAQLSVRFYNNGGALVMEDELGTHKVEKSDKPGYYLVDGKSYEALGGLKIRFGQYHSAYGEAVFYPL